MSRCFPFPPPGYDKKPIPEDSNALKEEKQKEKKHKKEKKDKERREGKEKRDKERSEGKHNDKKNKKDKRKDKKDKHREKKEKEEKEENDRGKEKEKNGTSEASKVVGRSEGKSWEKLHTKEGKDKNNYLDAAKFHGQNGEPVQSNSIARETEESKYVHELGRRIRDQEKVMSTQPERLSGEEKRQDDEKERFAVRNPGNLGEYKENSKNKEFEIRRVDGHGYREEARFTGHPMVQNPAGAAKTKVSGMPAPVEKSDEGGTKGKEKNKEKRKRKVDNHKDKDADKKDNGKEKDRRKKKKKEKKVKEKNEQKRSELVQKRSELDKSKDVNRSNLSGATDKVVFNLSSEHSNKANAEGILKKRRVLDINGFLHDVEIRPSKLQRSASHPVMENGRKLEASQTPGVFASDIPDIAANFKVDTKEHKKNGIVEPQSLPLSKRKPLYATVGADQILEVLNRHPHPDSKYLNQVLSFPKMDVWSDVVDNDWLSGNKELPSSKAEVCSVAVSEAPQVWSEALCLESADIVALPYVLPY